MKSNLPDRHSLRLPDYDYAHPGGYFVTIVTQKHICLFGEVVGDTVLLNGLGLITEECWQLIPEHFPNVELGAYVVMPNHLHGIIFIKETVGVTHASPLLGTIIGSFKSAVSHRIGQQYNISHLWQRNYYEHILRNEEDWRHIHDYILSNPLNWATDGKNPAGSG